METNLKNLIDFERVNTLLESFNKFSGFVTAILDLDGNVLSKSGWRQMCTDFHRINPETSRKCIISDTELANKMVEGEEFHFYKCLNGLYDVAIPIMINGEHIANLFSGQFLFEEPDINFFKRQAKQYGFDEEKYLIALKNVPIVSQEKVKSALNFLLNMTQIISEMGHQKLEDIEHIKNIRKSEEASQMSEANFRNLADSIHDGIVIAPANGQHIYANRHASEILGYTREEMLMTSQKDLADPAALPMLQQRLIDRIEGKPVPTCYETIIRRKDGSSFTAEISGTPILWQGQKCDMVLFRDITERKRIVKEIENNQQFLKSITSEVQEVIFALDAQGVFTFSEGKGLEKLGLKSGQVVGMSVFDVYKDFPEVIVGIKEALNGKMVKSDSLVVGNLNFTTTYQPIFDQNGQLTTVVGLAVDVTESKKTEKALNEHAIRIQTLLELNQMTHEPYENILDFVLDASQKMTGSEFSFVGVVDSEESELIIKRWSQGVMEQCKMATDSLSFQVSETGLLCECIRTRKPVLINNYDINTHPSKKGIPSGHVPIKRMMAVPSIENGHVVSVISLANKSEDYTEDDALAITSLLYKMVEIKKWQEADEALKQSKRELATLMNNLPGMVYSCLNDQNWTMQFVSEGVLLLTGYLSDDLIGNKTIAFDEIILSEDREMVWNTIQSSLKTKTSYDLEYRIIDKSGVMKYVWDRGQGIYNNKGDLLNLEGFITDISEKKQIEEELKSNYYVLRMAGKTARFGGWSVNLAKNIVVWSDQVKSIHEMPEEYIPNINEGIAFYPLEWREEITKVYMNCVENGIPYDEEMEIITGKGNRIWIRTTGEALVDQYGKITKINGSFQDINESKLVLEVIKKNEARLRELNSTKDKFFSIIAHDLRGPFNSFLGLTQIMAEELQSLTMSQLQEIAVSMSKSANNLYRLLENLLHWSRMQQGAIPFNPESIELDIFVEESIEMIQDQAQNKGIKLISNIPNSLVVFADTNLIQTVIRNLVSNAVKFTNKDGKVVVLARAVDENYVEISIKDTGIGLSKNMIDNLFHIDIQTSRKGTEGELSTGLGLILCKEFIEKHGGKIWVESEEGVGSTFYFTLPNHLFY